MSDPIADFLRGERERLLRAAPPPHAASVWHEARRRRGASLRRGIRAMGWSLRLLVAAAALFSFLWLEPEAHFLLLLCILSIWLTRGACAPARRNFGKGTLA